MIFHMISPRTNRSKITVVSSKNNIVQVFVLTKKQGTKIKSHKINNKTKQATNKMFVSFNRVQRKSGLQSAIQANCT